MNVLQAVIEGLLVLAVGAIAAFLLRLHRREDARDEAVTRLVNASKEYDAMPPRIQRLELVVGIDPSGGGGLATQIEELSEKMDNASRERHEQNAVIMQQLTNLTAAIRELPHTIRAELAEAREALDRRVFALELDRRSPNSPP